MTAWAGLLPFADAPDLSERFQRLDDHLRKAPATGDGSEIFDLAWDAFLALPEEPTTEARALQRLDAVSLVVNKLTLE